MVLPNYYVSISHKSKAQSQDTSALEDGRRTLEVLRDLGLLRDGLKDYNNSLGDGIGLN